MSLADYATKHVSAARERGLVAAGTAAVLEAALKGLGTVGHRFGTPIWADDWDVCLVLDACRVDVMREVALWSDWLPRDIPSRWSVGSASPEWISETFALEYADELERTAYITANPFSAKQGDEVDCLDPAVVPLAEHPHLGYLDEVWRDQWPASEELPTVDPETLTGRAAWAYEELKPERLVVHYMQPHVPFRTKPEWCAGWNLDEFGTGGGYGEKDDWHKVRDGEIDRDVFWTAYRANLEWVLEEVSWWVHATHANILVTSDHGNGMGECGVWSHPPGVFAPTVRRVPWITLKGQGSGHDPPALVGDPPVVGGEGRVDEQLEALGYT